MSVTLSGEIRSIARAKYIAKGWMPYLSTLLFGMRCYPETSIETMCVDEYCRMYYNPDFVAGLSGKKLAYCLLHEVLHVALSHAKRREAVLPQPTQQQAYLWNVAADLCIQQMLARHHAAQEPPDIVRIQGQFYGTPFLQLPGMAPNLPTERYYEVLNRLFSDQPPPPAMQQAGGGSQQQQNGSGQQQPQPGGSQPQPSPTGSKPGGVLSPEAAGSSSDGVTKPFERATTKGMIANVEAKLAEVEKRIEEAESARPGTVPGDLKSAIKVRLRKQTDPFDQLRSIVARSVSSPIGTDDFTYRRLSRRQPANCARLRGVVRLAPECVVLVDTSGSMECGDCRDKAIFAVSQGLRRVHRPRVICWDADLQSSKRLSSMAQFQWEGGGGTSMDEAVREIDRQFKPDAIVCITDGETDWPDEKPRARLVVALVKKPKHCGMPPDYAKVVKCYEKGESYGA